MPEWELREIGPIDCTLDDSGVYVTIHRVVEKRTFKDMVGDVVRVRADVMTTKDEPIISFIGSANNVRKHLLRFFTHRWVSLPISIEHASYLGYELLRAEGDPCYVQD